MNPMLLEDFKTNNLPVSLANILKYCDATKTDLGSDDYIAIFVYISMLELGFVKAGCTVRADPYYQGFHYSILLNQTQCLPSNWQRKDCYNFTLELPGFPLNRCKLICLKVADDIVVNASMVNSPNNNTSVLIDPKLYILDSRKGRLRFQNLKKFSTLIKSQIGFPFVIAILRRTNPDFTVFNLLPIEVYEYILKYCKRVDREKLQRIINF